MKKRNLTDVKDILKNAVNENFYKYGLKILLLRKNWIDIVGEKLLLFTYPEYIKHKTLVVICIHQGWINTLKFHKNDILSTIKSKFNEYFFIEDIIFKFGKIENRNENLDNTSIIRENFNNNDINKNNNIKIESKEDLIKQIKIFFEDNNKK